MAGSQVYVVEAAQSVRKLRGLTQAYFAPAETARPKTGQLYMLQEFMDFGDISGQLRKWQDEALKRRVADAPDRALRLFPEIVERWTNVLIDAAQLVEPGRTPCDYDPWIRAIGEAGLQHGFRAHPNDLVPTTSIASRLRNFIEDVSLPAWPQPRRDLVEFALVVLETDVMLFRSGYAKRHLIMRLKQSDLTGDDIQRVDQMLRRAVTQGTGLEEYRAWCKLAAHMVANGHLGDLPAWLYPQATGAFLNYSMADGRLAQQFWAADLPDDALRKLAGGVWRGSRHAIAWPNFRAVVETGGAMDTEAQRIKRNAWRMLDHILRRIPQLERDLAALPEKSGEIFEK